MELGFSLYPLEVGMCFFFIVVIGGVAGWIKYRSWQAQKAWRDFAEAIKAWAGDDEYK